MNKSWALALMFMAGIILGSVGTYVVHHPAPKKIALYEHLLDDDLNDPRSYPFRRLDKMRRDMDHLFHNMMADSLWYSGTHQMTHEEDGSYVYYKVDLKGLDKDSVRINVENGHVSIAGEIREAHQNDDSRSRFMRSFRKILPVPEGVDESKVDFQTEGDKIVIKFPKASATQV